MRQEDVTLYLKVHGTATSRDIGIWYHFRDDHITRRCAISSAARTMTSMVRNKSVRVVAETMHKGNVARVFALEGHQ